MSTSPCRKAYDHRLRDITCEDGNPMLFRDLGVPRFTAASWIRRGQHPVVSAQVLALDQLELQGVVLGLERRIKFLLAIIRLAFLLVRLSGFHLDTRHVPDGATKRSILDAIAHATKAIPLAVALWVLRLSAARYHDWSKRPPDCSLDDRSSCPHTSPTRVTAKEVSEMRDMVVSQDNRHMSIFSLALRAQRIGRIFLSPSTWGRFIRERGWLRPRHRVYPAKPKEGIRATKPNERAFYCRASFAPNLLADHRACQTARPRTSESIDDLLPAAHDDVADCSCLEGVALVLSQAACVTCTTVVSFLLANAGQQTFAAACGDGRRQHDQSRSGGTLV
jgi:hypothetical protein